MPSKKHIILYGVCMSHTFCCCKFRPLLAFTQNLLEISNFSRQHVTICALFSRNNESYLRFWTWFWCKLAATSTAIRLDTDIITAWIVARCPAVATHHAHKGHLAVGVGVNPPRHDQPAPSLYGGHPLTHSQAGAYLPGCGGSQGRSNCWSYLQYYLHLCKLDGVGPVDNRPSND